MLKKDLIKMVAGLSGHTEKAVREIMDAMLTAVLTSLAGGTSVMLLGLGKFSVRQRGERVARNIHTGEKVIVEPRKVALFKSSDALNAAVNATPAA